MLQIQQKSSPFLFTFLAAVVVFISSFTLLTIPAVAATNDFTPHKICKKGVTNDDGTPRTYQDYAVCIAGELDHALVAYHKKDYETAYKYINEAYFGWYENQLEPQSMRLAGNRKIKTERRFSEVKKALKDNPERAELDQHLNTLKNGIARDAMVLDGVLNDGAPESAGAKLLETNAHKEKVSQSRLNWVDFATSLTLLLREGLEAMLVVVAIALYLIKAGHKRLTRFVYYGAATAIVLSFILAWIMKWLVGGASQASELIEGATMFIAVAMLFYISNWMLSKTSGENWSHYIQGMVKTSVSTGAAFALVFASFLAVFREGAELVLFYTAAFSGEGHSPSWIAAGFSVGVIILAVIFVIFRFGGARLPVRTIFFATSILLFIMCISFVGKGVQELREADIIQGSTSLPWVKYYMPELGIFPQAETLLPQLILLIASIWLIINHLAYNRSYKKQVAVTQSDVATSNAQTLSDDSATTGITHQKMNDSIGNKGERK